MGDETHCQRTSGGNIRRSGFEPLTWPPPPLFMVGGGEDAEPNGHFHSKLHNSTAFMIRCFEKENVWRCKVKGQMTDWKAVVWPVSCLSFHQGRCRYLGWRLRGLQGLRGLQELLGLRGLWGLWGLFSLCVSV